MRKHIKLLGCVIFCCYLALANSLLLADRDKNKNSYFVDFNSGPQGWIGGSNDDKSRVLSEWRSDAGVKGSGGWYMADPNRRWTWMECKNVNVVLEPTTLMKYDLKINGPMLLHHKFLDENGKVLYEWSSHYKPTGDNIVRMIDFQTVTHKIPSSMVGVCIGGIRIEIPAGSVTIDNIRLGSEKEEASVAVENDEFDKIVKHQNEYPHILILQGLYHEFFKISEAVKVLGKSEVRTSQFSALANDRSTLNYFPESYNELMDYDVIVMADIDTQCFGGRGRGGQMLKSFVRKGGGLLILGGPYAYGQGDYKSIDEIIPYVVGGPFDIQRIKGPGIINPKGSSSIVEGISWKETPICLYRHNLQAKPGAQTVLVCDGKPFLVTYQYGKGKIAALSGTVYGQAPVGQVAFWDWKQWPLLMGNTLKWLAGNKSKYYR